MSSVRHTGDLGIGDRSVTDAVREAAESVGRRGRESLFSLTQAGAAEKIVAPMLGIYLGYAVARLPEVFPALAVPRLPMVLLALFMVLLAVAIPPDGWQRAWQVSLPLKCVVVLFVLAIVTTPLGIWMGGSIWFIRNRYIIAVTIFLACLMFLRDRRTMRTAVSLYVLSVFAIAVYTLLTYDPNAIAYDQYGVPLDPGVFTDRQRIKVSVSLDSNDWGAVLATSVPLAAWLSTGSFLRRIFWGGITLTLIAAIVPTASRGSLLGLMAGGLVLVMVGATGWRRLILLALMAGAGLVFSMVATQGQLTRFFDFGTDDYNVSGNEGRLYFWRQGLVWMIKRPWGYGIDNFPVYFGWLNGPDRAAHSIWVQYGVELGVLGLTTFGLLCYTLVRRHRRNRKAALLQKRAPGDLADREAILSGHMLAMLASTLVTGSFLSNAYYPLTYMALGIAGAAMLGSPLRDVPAPETGAPALSDPVTARRGVIRQRRPGR